MRSSVWAAEGQFDAGPDRVTAMEEGITSGSQDGVSALTLAHMGAIHGLAVVWMPLLMGIGLWLGMRTGKEEPSEEEEAIEVSEER
jgi:hypothetical protein